MQPEEIRAAGRFVVAAGWSFFVVVSIAIVALDERLLVRVLAGTAGVGFGALAYRAVMSRLTLDGQGVTAVADRFTRRVAWADVSRFEYRGVRGLGATTHDGTWIRLQDYGIAERKAAEEAARALERRRKNNGDVGRNGGDA